MSLGHGHPPQLILMCFDRAPKKKKNRIKMQFVVSLNESINLKFIFLLSCKWFKIERLSANQKFAEIMFCIPSVYVTCGGLRYCLLLVESTEHSGAGLDWLRVGAIINMRRRAVSLLAANQKAPLRGRCRSIAAFRLTLFVFEGCHVEFRVLLWSVSRSE